VFVQIFRDKARLSAKFLIRHNRLFRFQRPITKSSHAMKLFGMTAASWDPFVEEIDELLMIALLFEAYPKDSRSISKILPAMPNIRA
jgi:hypothetical protein